MAVMEGYTSLEFMVLLGLLYSCPVSMKKIKY